MCQVSMGVKRVSGEVISITTGFSMKGLNDAIILSHKSQFQSELNLKLYFRPLNLGLL